MQRNRVLIGSSVLVFILILVTLLISPAQGSPVYPKPTKTPTPTPSPTSGVLITALLFDPYLSNEPEEAVQIQNIGSGTVSIAGWKISDNEGTVTFPSGSSLAPGQKIWVTKTATRFRDEFGFNAAFEYGGNSDPAVPDMTGTAPTFANSGDEVVLLDASSNRVDVLVYDGGNWREAGWGSRPTVTRYDQGYFGLEGQILYRKMAEATGLPVADTNSAADWAQTEDDDILGKKIQYPGWDLDEFFQTKDVTENVTVKYCVAPDALYDCLIGYFNSATSYIRIEGYTLNSAQLIDVLVARLQAGVSVTVLLEQEVVNGIEDQEKWACQQIENNGGECWFMNTDDTLDIHDRYNFQHSKFTIIDGAWLLTGSENLGASALAADDKADGTWGNRGVYLVANSSGLISHFATIFARDQDPANHKDLRRWNPATDSPPAGFVPDYTTGGTGYSVQFPTPFTATATFSFEVVQCPENCLRGSDALLGLVARAGAGDVVLVEQLYERKYWGPSSSNPSTDPNPRLEAYIDAAQRGAAVQIILDSFYDDPTDTRSNRATCQYVNGLGLANLSCRLGNPTGTGIHNKMVLVLDGGQGYVHTGSINGSENSSKDNREIAMQLASTDAYNYLKSVFDYDWSVSSPP